MTKEYKTNYKFYSGNHDVLHAKPRGGNRPDNHIVYNLCNYAVDSFNGYFIGIPPKIGFDDQKANAELQSWQDLNSFQDQLSELSKQADIYGRSYLLAYQDEDSQTRVAVVNPQQAFMIYDDSIQHKRIAFVRYWFNDDQQVQGDIYFKDQSYHFGNDGHFGDETPNLFHMVPAIEFVENEDRLGIVGQIESLNDALDRAMSQKANQNEYFDNAYMLIRGMQLPEDEETGLPKLNLDGNQIIYAPDATDGDASFLTKPDGDQMQENHINRLIDSIFQVAKVANLKDESFAGDSSGIAIKYKLLPMQNAAVNKERKFTQALRQFYEIVFAIASPQLNIKDLSFKFTRNLPVNLADEADTAGKLAGIVSQETQLKTLSVVDDPQAEIKKMDKENQAKVKAAMSASLTDYEGSKSDEQEKQVDSNQRQAPRKGSSTDR
jgi:SPP1 family phage portal protein